MQDLKFKTTIVDAADVTIITYDRRQSFQWLEETHSSEEKWTAKYVEDGLTLIYYIHGLSDSRQKNWSSDSLVCDGWSLHPQTDKTAEGETTYIYTDLVGLYDRIILSA